MSGIGLVLNTAKDALLTQQYAIDVASHNIANVSTDGYTRQVPVLGAQQATPYGGHLFGRGVELNEIMRNTNSFIEQRLRDGNTDLTGLSEKGVFLNVMESIFNENSSRSLSNQMADFWNAWNDLANNPSGLAERNILTEYGTLLSQSFNELVIDLDNLDHEIHNSIDTGVDNINELLKQIAEVNNHILFNEINGNANDLRDQRDILVNELAGYIDINTYENEGGTLTVTTGKGYILVSKSDTYPLDYDGNEVNWQSSAKYEIAISDTITGGSMGGWLEMRDEIIPKYRSDLDELAKSLVWELNKIHSQGVGLEGFDSLVGTYQVADSSMAMGSVDSGLDFYDGIEDGSFKIWLYDASGAVVGESSIIIDADITTMDDLAIAIENLVINGEDALNASLIDGRLAIETDMATHSGYTFAFSDDTSNVLAALGVNTFFHEANAREISLNDAVLNDKNLIAAALVGNNVSPAIQGSGNSSTGTITTSGPYTGSSDAVYEVEILTGGTESTAVFRWRQDGGPWTSVDLAVSGSTVPISNGIVITFNAGNYTLGDTFSINALESSNTYGEFVTGDNTNALNLANLQYEGVTIQQWTYERGVPATSYPVTNTTIDDYLHLLVSRVGIESQSNQREMDSKTVIVNEISKTRDNISAVSLDEEMANLIKYQHAYSAAAKLITTAEEMLDTLLNSKR
jgi:flagellar hook-associated protein 1 FlgK